MIELAIISGTDRPGANALKVSRYLKREYEMREASVRLLNMQDFPVDAVKGGPYGKTIPELEPFVQTILDSDGLVMVIPEYNGSFPGILKLFIDYLPFPDAFEKLPICFVGESSGAFGAMRAVEQMQMVAGYRNAYIFPERVFISRVHKNFDKEQGIRDEFQRKLMKSQIDNFVEYVHSLKNDELVSKPMSL